MKRLFSKKLWIALTAVFAVFMAILIAAYFITDYFRVSINAALQTDDYKVIPDPDAQILYEPLAYTDEALAQHERELCEDLEGEGATLLFNKDGTLPLAQDTKFSCFRSRRLIFCMEAQARAAWMPQWRPRSIRRSLLPLVKAV